MKTKICACILCVTLMTLAFASYGCTQEKAAPRCAKCGAAATTTLSGPAETFEDAGIPLSKCTQVVPNVYSAPVCDNCPDWPKAELKPDP